MEGFEPRVLRGGQEFFSSGVTDFVLVEVSEWTQPRSGFHYSTIYDTLKLYGFRHIYAFAKSTGTKPFRHVDLAQLPVECNVLFSRNMLDQPIED